MMKREYFRNEMITIIMGFGFQVTLLIEIESEWSSTTLAWAPPLLLNQNAIRIALLERE